MRPISSFRAAYEFLVVNRGHYLVHGVIGMKLRGQRRLVKTVHAWVEHQEEGLLMCYDPLTKTNLPAATFYKKYRIWILQRYKLPQAASLYMRLGAGPWNKRVKALK